MPRGEPCAAAAAAPPPSGACSSQSRRPSSAARPPSAAPRAGRRGVERLRARVLRRAALAGGAALRGLLVGPADLRGLVRPLPDAVDADDKMGALSRLTALPAALRHCAASSAWSDAAAAGSGDSAGGSAAPRVGGGHLPCGDRLAAPPRWISPARRPAGAAGAPRSPSWVCRSSENRWRGLRSEGLQGAWLGRGLERVQRTLPEPPPHRSSSAKRLPPRVLCGARPSFSRRVEMKEKLHEQKSVFDLVSRARSFRQPARSSSARS